MASHEHCSFQVSGYFKIISFNFPYACPYIVKFVKHKNCECLIRAY